MLYYAPVDFIITTNEIIGRLCVFIPFSEMKNEKLQKKLSMCAQGLTEKLLLKWKMKEHLREYWGCAKNAHVYKGIF